MSTVAFHSGFRFLDTCAVLATSAPPTKTLTNGSDDALENMPPSFATRSFPATIVKLSSPLTMSPTDAPAPMVSGGRGEGERAVVELSEPRRFFSMHTLMMQAP